MHDQLALTSLILFCSVLVARFLIITLRKLKRQRQQEAFEHGIRDYLRQVRSEDD